MLCRSSTRTEKLFFNCLSVVDWRVAGRRLFHMDGPETAILRGLYFDTLAKIKYIWSWCALSYSQLASGGHRSPCNAEHWRPVLHCCWQRQRHSDTFLPDKLERPYTRTWWTVCKIHAAAYRIGSQWRSSRRVAVMWSYFRFLMTRRAAALRANCGSCKLAALWL